MRRVGTHPFTSQEKAVELGNLVRGEFPRLEVDLRHPDLELHVEIREGDCYLYTEVIQGAGGLPLGVEGSLVALVSGGIDSPVAAWMMMKRGCRILPIFVALESFLGDDARERAGKVVELLRPYQPDIRLQRDPGLVPGLRKEGARAGEIWRSTPASSASGGCTGLPGP